MGILHNWPLAFLIVIPIIILLYVLKQKAEEKQISSLYLWREAFKNMEATTPWEKLRHNLLMYLQILIMLVLIAALLGPYLKKAGTDYKNVVLVLDNSGSMNALYDNTKTRLEIAKEKAKEYMKSIDKDTMVTIVSSNQTAKLEVSNGSDRSTLEKIIDSIEETEYPGDLSSSISFVESMVSQWESYEAVFFSDQSVNMQSIQGKVVSLQSEGVNGAIDYVSHSMDENGMLTVLVKVSNYGTKHLNSDINLYLDETMLDIQSVSLAPSESKVLYFEGIEKKNYDSGMIQAEINEKDSLQADNVAYDKLERDETKKILLVTEQNIFLEKALQTKENIELYKTSDADIDTVSMEEEEFDLYVYDNIIPKKVPEKGNVIFINPTESIVLEEMELFQVDETKDATKVTSHAHAVTDYLSKFSFGVNAYQKISKPIWAESFLEAGEDSVGFMGLVEGRVIAVLAFDIHQSDLALQTEFPIFIYQLLGQCLNQGFVKDTILKAGETIEIYTDSKSKQIEVVNPDGEHATLAVTGTRTNYSDTKKSGIYTIIKQTGKQEQVIIQYPVATESKLKESLQITGSDKTKENSVISADTISGALDIRPILIVIGIVFVLLEWFVYSKNAHITKKRRKWMLRGFRSVIVLLLVFALLDIDVVLASQKTTTIFLLDVSDSAAGYTSEGELFIKEAIKQMPKKEQAGVIAFGKDARVEQFVTEKNLFTEIETTPITTATNLEKAVQSSMALFPENSSKRLVLITDGNENEGSLSKMASTLLGNQVATEIVKIDNISEHEVYVDQVTIPEKVKIGDTFQVKVQVKSNIKTSANIYLYSGTDLKVTEQVELQVGDNTFLFKDTQTASGLKNYRVRIEAKEDTRSINNEYVAFTQAQAGEKVLLIEGEPEEAEAFEEVLKAANITYDKIMPQAAPRSVIEMNQYKSILLLDVYADDLPEVFLNQIESYVKDYAGGLIAIGGEDSFALGNYKDTSLEKVLPVYMDLQGEKQIPETAIAMVIDHSGSMSNGNRYISQLDLAKQAAAAALSNLRETDYVGVLAFESSYDWVVPVQKATDTNKIEEAIYGIPLGGGTSIYPAVKEAYEQLKKCSAKIKHIILLTDGQDGFGDYKDLMKKLNDSNITLSTVAVGDGSDTNLLSKLAEQGKGQYYYTDINSDLPRIFAKEVFLSAKAYLVQEEFTPIITSSSDIIKEVISDGMPTMYGYIASTKKELATTHLVSEKDDPILTTWQYGLGRTVAFNSDGTGAWTANYNRWSKYPALWKNIINWTITDTTGGENEIAISNQGSNAHVVYKTKDYTEVTQIVTTYTDEDGTVKEAQLEATSPGVFEGDIDLQNIGVYSVNVTQKEGEEVVQSQNTALAMQYSSEYRFTESSTVLEEFAAAASGIFIKDPNEVFSNRMPEVNTNRNLTWIFLVLAILFFLFDIINRRIHVSIGIIRRWTTYREKKVVKDRLVVPNKKKESKETMEVQHIKETIIEQEDNRKIKPKRDNSQIINHSEQQIDKKEDKKEEKKESLSQKKENRNKESNVESQVLDTALLLNKKRDRQEW